MGLISPTDRLLVETTHHGVIEILPGEAVVFDSQGLFYEKDTYAAMLPWEEITRIVRPNDDRMTVDDFDGGDHGAARSSRQPRRAKPAAA